MLQFEWMNESSIEKTEREFYRKNRRLLENSRAP